MFIRDYYYKVNDNNFNVEEVIHGHMEGYFREEIKKLKEVRGFNIGNSKSGKNPNKWGDGDLIENAGSEGVLMNLP